MLFKRNIKLFEKNTATHLLPFILLHLNKFIMIEYKVDCAMYQAFFFVRETESGLGCDNGLSVWSMIYKNGAQLFTI